MFAIIIFYGERENLSFADGYPFLPLSAEDPVPVFEMLYEKNPARSNFERRLEVSTQPLNIIYNPQAIKKVADFFYKGRVLSSGERLSLFLSPSLSFSPYILGYLPYWFHPEN